MTVSEISEAVEKNERTVQRWIKKLSDKMSSVSDKMSSSSPMNPSNYTLDETISIIEIGLGKNAANIFRSNAEQIPSRNEQVGNSDMRELKSMFMELMKMNMSLIQQVKAPQLEYKQDYYSVIGYANSKGIKDITVSEARSLSLRAKKLSEEKNIEVRKIPDERWGTANSYSLDVLKTVFEI